MTRSLLFPLVLAACTAGTTEPLPVDQAPPSSITLAVSPAIVPPGGDITIDISGAPANRTVYLGYTTAGTSPDALCPPILGGECLDLNGSVNLIFSLPADANGELSRTLTLPPQARFGTYFLQAATPLGANTPAAISPPESVEIAACDLWYADGDADGFGDDAVTVSSCFPLAGYVAVGGDCDDTVATTNPTADEVCNGVDDNCDGGIDEGGDPFYLDRDDDGFGDSTTRFDTCNPPPGFVPADGDCDDTNVAANPGMSEVCNGFDDDCDGTLDEEGNPFFLDRDGDGFGDADSPISACTASTALIDGVLVPYTDVSTDCDDNAANVNPNATEFCNLLDDNCDGVPDDGFDKDVYYADQDGDGSGVLPENCSDYAAGFAPSNGVYLTQPAGAEEPRNVFCDVNEGWTRVFRQAPSGGGYFADSADALEVNEGDPEAANHSQLINLADYRRADGTFEFRLTWPGSTFTGANVWSQTSDPRTEPIAGYQAIQIDYDDAGWGGLEPSNSPDALMDGAVGDPAVAFAIGATTGIANGLPGPGGSATSVELWVRNVAGDRTPFFTCASLPNLSNTTDDCDDTDPLTNPTAIDFCDDGLDQNCSGFDVLCDPKVSCLDHLEDNPAAGDGFYQLDRGAENGDYEAFCDMSGGGWTLVMKAIAANAGYDDPVWTDSILVNPENYDFNTPGEFSKYESFLHVPFQELRTSAPDSFSVAYVHELPTGSESSSAQELFSLVEGYAITSGPGTLEPHFVDILADDYDGETPYYSSSWGYCAAYISLGINTRDYMGTRTHVRNANDFPCNSNGGARFGQRINQCNRQPNGSCTGENVGVGWGTYPNQSRPILELLWVR